LIPFVRSGARDGRIPDSPVHWDTECYIPADPRDLIAWISTRSSFEYAKHVHFFKVCDFIRRTIHDDFRTIHDRITLGYRSVDPDNEELAGEVQSRLSDQGQSVDDNHDKSESSKSTNYQSDYALDECIEELLVRANYRRLNPREIQSAMRTASYWGVRLRVQLSMFRRLRVFGRGDIIGRKSRRFWKRGFRLEEIDVPIYRRLVLVFRVKESQTFQETLHAKNLHLRMFKNIPKQDVDMLLPAAGVKISWIDKGKIGIPTAWGFAMLVMKLAKSLSLLAVLGTFRFMSSLALIVAVALASLFYGVRSFFSYLTAKRRHLLNVAQNLYYQNLDNNLGVLLRVLEEAEQQEICEAIMGYYVISNAQSPDGLSEQEIYRQSINQLREYTGLEIDFDVKDAVRSLLELRIIDGTATGYLPSPRTGA
jgi:hypothetical protein